MSFKSGLIAVDAKVRPWAERRAPRAFAYEFVMFGLKQAWACLFGASILGLLLTSRFFWPAEAPLARYDALVLGALSIQLFMLAARLERPAEAAVILVFHGVGTAMEVFKVAHGSWAYPEPSVLRLWGVPLFSGFMYAAIGSYIARAFRLLDMRLEDYPPIPATWLVAGLAYANFFTHHYLPDQRWALFALSVLVFGRARLRFTPDRTPRRMPMVIGFLLVTLFIWVAENLGTFAAAWVYPAQQDGWRPVGLAKLGSWYLLMMLSFVLVTLVHPPERVGQGRAATYGSRSPGSAGAASGRS